MKIFVAIIVSFALFCNGFIVAPKQTLIPVKVARNVPFALAPQNPLVNINRAKQNERIGFVLFASSNQNIEWKIDDLIEDKLDYRNYGGNPPEGLFTLTANEMDDIFKEGEINGYLKKLKDVGINTLQHLKPLLLDRKDNSPKAREARKVVGRLFISDSVLSEMIRDASAKLRTTINPPKAYNPNKTLTPIYGLEKQYNSTMKCSNALLFKSWEYYKSSLPQRSNDIAGTNQYICLAEYEYWVNEKDLDLMVDSLLRDPEGNRALVKYVSLPSKSGKTSSAAAAFVRSTQNHNKTKQFSYYLYLPCENNNGRNFRYTGWVSQDEDEAENQGAQFAFECVEKLLNMEKLEPKKKVSPAESIDNASKRITELLEEKNIRGKILFHLDEHEKMNKANPHFRRGAMSALAKVGNATVLSTFTKVPSEISSDKTSAVCRWPVPHPPLDISLVVESLKQLKFPIDPADMDIDNKRLYATLMIRLGFYLSTKLCYIHFNAKEKFEIFKSEFYEASRAARQKPLNQAAVRKGLEACILKCWVPKVSICDSNAAALLIGIPEIKDNDEKVPSTSVFRSFDDKVYFTSPLDSLVNEELPISHPNSHWFQTAKDRFVDVFSGIVDVLSGTPLERAYGWTLFTHGLLKRKINFATMGGDKTFYIKAERLEPGRLFNDNKIESFSPETAKNLDINTIYFADEGVGSGSKDSHPMCDIFFRTEKNEIVMIDVTGSASNITIDEKIRQKESFIQSLGHGNDIQVRCFVLAPLFQGKIDGTGSRMLVNGGRAKFLLGGLAPILSWYNDHW